ncbi:MAG: penicillin-binding transpeptidase domain-containing protein, partial [Clostridiales bacterium]|nr:penicillin-binding transpeptidase domain-containing protein [Clostridiales bacterium]
MILSKRFSRSGYNNIAKNNTTKNNAANNNANYKENNNNRNGNGNSNIIKTGMNQKRRIAIVLFLLIAATVALSGNFAYIQLSWGTDLQRMAYAQQNRGRIISPRRGSILDRNGKELAISASVETVWVNPGDIKSADLPADEIAVKLAGMLDLDRESVYKKITASSSYQILKRKIDRTKGDEIREWIQNENLNGIYVDEDTKRFYPGGNLAAHVIGFTGIDNQGLDGIEAVMEKYLKGVPGRILSEVDNRGQELPFRSERRIDAQDGLNVVLTLDESIQYFTQKVIEKAIVDYKVNGGAVAIVMDPRSGDILSLVSYPDYDLNNPFASPPGVDSSTWSGNTAADVELLQKTLWRNKAVADTYEPGSTFKAITSAAGLEEGVITPESRVTDSPVKIGKWTLDCWRTGRLHGEESFREGVYNSCNPVFVRIAQSLGIERFYQYVRAFGFFEKTGIELPGEEQGVIHTKPAEIDMAVASFGQRFTITPIQLITAYSAIANGGMLMK